MNFRRIIAKEGVILLFLSVVIYSFIVLFFRNLPVIYPKYSLRFSNGATYIIDIYPDIDYSKIANTRSFLRGVHNPEPKLVSKRIGEFSRSVRVNSELRSATCINRIQLFFSELASNIISLNFLLRILGIYFILLILRFLIWSIKTLKITNPFLKGK